MKRTVACEIMNSLICVGSEKFSLIVVDMDTTRDHTLLHAILDNNTLS